MMKPVFSKQRYALALGTLLLLAIPAVRGADAPPAAPEINARAYILMDYQSGKVLAEVNADRRLDPASLTKIMSSYVIGQAMKAGKIHPTDKVTIEKDAWATGNPVLHGSSLIFLKPGEQVTVDDLNKGIVIQSGNDASIALAEHVAGSQDAFVSLMNQYAQALRAEEYPLSHVTWLGRGRAVQHRAGYGHSQPGADPQRSGRIRAK